MAHPRRISGFARRHQPDSRSELDRDGDSYRPSTSGLVGADDRGRLFHSLVDVRMIALPISWKSFMAAAAPAAAAAGMARFGLWPLFLFFLKVGSVLYGSGYVLLAFLRSGLVERLGWLNENQLLDAIAVGQITPGPVFTTATFIGYILGGTRAALTATAGIFLPAFVFVA